MTTHEPEEGCQAPDRRSILDRSITLKTWLGVVSAATLAVLIPYSQGETRASTGSIRKASVSCVFRFADVPRPFVFGHDDNPNTLENYQGGGIDDAVHLIEGSGSSPEDPCFEATQDWAKEAAGTHSPHFGEDGIDNLPVAVEARAVENQ